MKIYKLFWTIVPIILCIGVLVACDSISSSNQSKNSTTDITNVSEESNRFSVVCTIYPQYDWVNEIIGDTDMFDTTLLLDDGTDPHSYQPTANDMIKISSCDLFIYVGGESDAWVDDALKNATNPNMIIINLMDTLGDSVVEEEIVEGMQEEEEISEDDDIEYDEHVWLSLQNAEIFCETIVDSLSSLDSTNADTYRSNTDTYIDSLNELDAQYESVVNNSTIKTILVGDRFPFRYLVDDYGINYYAAFVGCSAETEASFETIVFLANKVDELSLESVLTIDGSDQSIAKTIINNTATKDQEILVLDSMQSVSKDDIHNGVTYLSKMESNLEVLKKALR